MIPLIAKLVKFAVLCESADALQIDQHSIQPILLKSVLTGP